MTLEKDLVNNNDNALIEEEVLRKVYENGVLFNQSTFDEVRKRASL